MLTLTATQGNGDDLPAGWASFNGSAFLLSPTEAGELDVTVTASDSYGASV